MKLIEIVDEIDAVRSNEEFAALMNELYSFGDISVGFLKLSKAEQVKLTGSLVIMESLSRDFSFGPVNSLYERLKENINEIENKILNGQANAAERRMYSAYISRCIFHEVKINKKAVNMCAMQIISNNDELCEDNVFVFMQYALNCICQEEDREIEFIARDGGFGLWTISAVVNKIYINRQIEEYLYFSLNKEDVENLIVWFTFALLHEVQHIRQFRDLRGNSDLDNSQVFKEIIVGINNPEFYKENHDSFAIEKQANQYAYDFIHYFLKDIINENRLNEIINEYGFEKMINEKDLGDKIDEYYSKLVAKHFDEIQEGKKNYEGLKPSRK